MKTYYQAVPVEYNEVVLNTSYADNGEVSHHEIINSETGEVLASTDPTETIAKGQPVISLKPITIAPVISDEEIDKLCFGIADDFLSSNKIKMHLELLADLCALPATEIRDRLSIVIAEQQKEIERLKEQAIKREQFIDALLKGGSDD